MDENVREALTRNGSIIDITTTGRKSGEPRRIEIVFHNVEGKIYISGYPRPQKRNWLSNMEAHPEFTFHLKNEVKADLAATAHPITDPAERRAVLEKLIRIWEQVGLEDAVAMSPLVEVTFKD